MDVLANLFHGLQIALIPLNVFYCFVGVMLGTLIGVLPGIAPSATIAMLLPLTFSLPADAALIMLAGVYYGAQYGGSTSAILINLPGESSSVMTAVDGYQMARQGRAGPALAISAIGSFFAGTVATLVIAFCSALLTRVALSFESPDYFSLIVLGLVGSVVLAQGSMPKALAMVVLGMTLGVIGMDVYSGMPRLTLGQMDLLDGLSLPALAVGLFGVSEILRSLEHEQSRSIMSDGKIRAYPSRDDLRASVGPIARGTLIGSLLGILPGGGALLAPFASYALEKKIARDPERFGKGAIEGVASPESANNAAAQTSFIPMLSLGIPSNPVMALMIGAMIIQGIVPGPGVATQKPDLFWGLIASMWVGNFILVVLNLPLIGIWISLLRVPYYMLFPGIVVFASIGINSITGNAFDLYSIVAFGVSGYLLTKLGCEPAPLLLGFVLGPMLEEYLRRSMIVSHGDASIFFTRPISAGLLLLAAIMLVIAVFPKMSSFRERVFVED